jgi:hypothetical protein
LFQIITKPKEDIFGASYDRFLSKDLIEHLNPSDLPEALRWVRNQPSFSDLPYALAEVADSILSLAAENLDQPNVAEAFAITVLDRLKKHDGHFDHPNRAWQRAVRSNESIRHRIIEVLPSKTDDPKELATDLAYSGLQIISKDDIHWIVYKLEKDNGAFLSQ